MKDKIQSFGRFLSGMVMPNIGALIAWGLITALFIATGWLPNEELSTMVGPFLSYVIPVLIAFQGGKMVAGQRGAVMGVIATVGVICGEPNYTMLMGAMLMGPLAGWVIKQFDKAVDGKIKAGFEMLVNNFSVGILGMLMAILGFYVIGPVMGAILAVLNGGVDVLVNNNLLPLVSIFVEPAKVLFLNNAINHGIFTPLGAQQVEEMGRSIFYMIETNPGSGTGVILAYWLFSKDKLTRDSAPGALIVHLLGGIHEIYFPYVLMNPLLLLATIGGSVVAMFYNTIFDLGLAGPASPGSIFAYVGMAAKGQTIAVLFSAVIAAAVSFVIAVPIVRLANPKTESLEDATAQMKSMKAESKGETVVAPAKEDTVACPESNDSQDYRDGVLLKKNIILNTTAKTKEEAVKLIGEMFCKCGYTTPKYTEAMLEKEKVFNTYLGNGVSIPHGVEEMRSEILNSGVVVLTSRDGIDWGNGNKANLIVGVASVGDEHMKTLQNIALHCGSPADVEKIINLDVDGVYDIFKG